MLAKESSLNNAAYRVTTEERGKKVDPVCTPLTSASSVPTFCSNFHFTQTNTIRLRLGFVMDVQREISCEISKSITHKSENLSTSPRQDRLHKTSLKSHRDIGSSTREVNVDIYDFNIVELVNRF